ncbi:MAG TPA: glutathione S-transferase family protein [Sphingopyxis sp.]|uniref:glutathione S-transferase family protein n=1 Tax=Sphingopyxis sp. TaxID=1908224 RepID=UPI002E33FFD2|nr:glutathione S-transferase family protein [Sphingopyxis sp.]HEX2812652.1 glutathione S-transferase family protein [Sphingopyxis sp.]
MTARPLLFGSLLSGHSYKVRLALLLLGIEHDYRAIDLSRPHADRDSDWRRWSRFGEVPVLVADGRAMTQSNAILLHLARTHDALGWRTDRDAVTEWLFWEANRIGLSLPNYRLCQLSDAPLPPDVAGWLHERMIADLAWLEKELAERAFLVGDAVSAADIACSAYLHYRDVPGLALRAYPAIDRWLGRIAALPGWRAPLEVMGEGRPE